MTSLVKVLKVKLAVSFLASVSLTYMSHPRHLGYYHASLLQHTLVLLFIAISLRYIIEQVVEVKSIFRSAPPSESVNVAVVNICGMKSSAVFTVNELPFVYTDPQILEVLSQHRGSCKRVLSRSESRSFTTTKSEFLV